MHEFTYSYPDFSISAGTNLAAEIVFGAAALAALAYCISIARRDRKVWPLWLFAGAAVTTVWEPFTNMLLRVAYPQGSRTMFDAWFGRDIPWYLLGVYIFYFALPGAWLYQRFTQGVTKRQVVRYLAVGVVLAAAFEPALVAMDLWTYYGVQPFDWTGMPIHWAFTDAACVVFVVAACVLVRKHILTSDRQTWVFVPLMIMALWASKSVDMPLAYLMNSTDSELVLSIASLATIALTIFEMCGIVLVMGSREIAQPSRPVVRSAPPIAREPVSTHN